MDTQIETSIASVDQVPPPIILTTDSIPTEPATATTVAIETTTEDSPEPPSDMPSQPSTEPRSEELPDAPQGETQTIEDADPALAGQSAPPELEHAYWAEIEEDSTVPDETEMKEIESAADGDYSAYECKLPNHGTKVRNVERTADQPR